VDRSLPPRFITTRAIRRSEKALHGRELISPRSSAPRRLRLFSFKGESERQERPAVAVLIDACGQSRYGGSVPDEQLSIRTRRSPNLRNRSFSADRFFGGYHSRHARTRRLRIVCNPCFACRSANAKPAQERSMNIRQRSARPTTKTICAMTIIVGILITISSLSTAVAWRRRFRRRHRKQPSREIEGFRTGIVISSEMIPMRWLQNSFRSSTLSNAGVARSFKRASTHGLGYVIFPMVEFSFSVLG